MYLQYCDQYMKSTSSILFILFYVSAALNTYAGDCRKHELLEEDVTAHGDRINDLNSQCDEFITAGVGDTEDMQNRRESINERFANVQVSSCRASKNTLLSGLSMFRRQ